METGAVELSASQSCISDIHTAQFYISLLLIKVI